MAQIDQETFHDLLNFLEPHMEKDRDAILDGALYGSEVLSQIDRKGAPHPFTVKLVKTLQLFDKEVAPGLNPLAAILQECGAYVEDDKKQEMARLVKCVQPKSKTVHWESSPYPGLRYFVIEEAEVYFGRAFEIAALVNRLSDPACRFLCVIGASGSGKSSLVLAGLLPRLKDNAIPGSRYWVWERIVPGKDRRDPFKSLAWSLDSKLEPLGYRPDDIATKLAEDHSFLNELCKGLLQRKDNQAELLLFIDQMEELFTLDSKDKVAPFIEFIDYAAHQPRIRVIATLRADFYADCIDYNDPMVDLLNRGTFNLRAPGSADLIEMITKPADCAGLELDRGLVHHILEDTGNEPGSLALMAFTLQKLYEAGDGKQLTFEEAYRNIKGVKGAIGHQAGEVFKALSPSAKEAFPSVFRELISVTADGTPTRKRAPLESFKDNPSAQELIGKFCGPEARLLVTDKQGQTPTVEVAHEKLFESWPLLKKWIDERRDALRLKQQVENAAREWAESGQQTSHLWRHERLEPVYEMLERLDITTLKEPLKSFVRKEGDRLLEELEDIETTHYRRAEIGDRLAQIGDTRIGVGIDGQGVPDIDWVRMPGGRIELEYRVGTFDVEPFFIARYPITYRQYRAFLEAADGYEDKRWWDDLERKKTWGEQYRSLDNCPAENVSWFDAMAFCRWLSARLGYQVRLPKEWEWQQAATGGNPENSYPWGADWDGRLANISESHLSRTTAVGMYPGGRTLQGAHDMAGNVWEWCLNKYDDPNDNAIGGKDWRVWRGGSWVGLQDFARAAFRYRIVPDYRYYFLGFRVCCLSPIT
jgi:formylglycine-generating enzyme required for sulfatase activity